MNVEKEASVGIGSLSGSDDEGLDERREVSLEVEEESRERRRTNLDHIDSGLVDSKEDGSIESDWKVGSENGELLSNGEGPLWKIGSAESDDVYEPNEAGSGQRHSTQGERLEIPSLTFRESTVTAEAERREFEDQLDVSPASSPTSTPVLNSLNVSHCSEIF